MGKPASEPDVDVDEHAPFPAHFTMDTSSGLKKRSNISHVHKYVKLMKDNHPRQLTEKGAASWTHICQYPQAVDQLDGKTGHCNQVLTLSKRTGKGAGRQPSQASPPRRDDGRQGGPGRKETSHEGSQ